MTAPDQSAAFEADAQRVKDTSVEALQARVRELEAQQAPGDPYVPTGQQGASQQGQAGPQGGKQQAQADAEIFDANGRPVGEEPEGEEGKVEAPHVAAVAGTEFRFHAPKQTALLAFGLGTSNRRDGALVLASMQRFLSFHLDAESYDVFMERMSDPYDEWSDDDFGELVNALVEVASESPEALAPKTGPANR